MVKAIDTDAIITSDPIDGNAAKVTSPGFQYKPRKIIANLESEVPLPMRTVPFNVTDLTGKRNGRLTVLGLYIYKSQKKGASRNEQRRWVVRCDCGKYSIRASKAINNPKNNADACNLCRHALMLKRNDLHNQGIDVHMADLI